MPNGFCVVLNNTCTIVLCINIKDGYSTVSTYSIMESRVFSLMFTESIAIYCSHKMLFVLTICSDLEHTVVQSISTNCHIHRALTICRLFDVSFQLQAKLFGIRLK